MKLVKLTAVALIAAISMGCHDGNLSWGGSEDIITSNKGLLSIADMSVDCRIDESDPEVGVLSTRTTQTTVDVNNFDCSIIDEENNVVLSFKYGERPTDAIELDTGDYLFKMVSGMVQGAAWESPVYGATKPFKIVRNETTNLLDIVCSLMQIKVSVSYSDDLLERLGEKTVTIVSVGENSLEYSLVESRAGFFLAPNVNNNISLRISGTYAADKENFKIIEMNKEVRDVKAGQHSKIHFYIEHAEAGNINVGVTVRDWVTDEIVPCNVADLVKEEEWIDGGNEGGNVEVAPITVEWKGYDMSQRVTIDSTTTGEITIRASKGIKELIVRIDSPGLAPILPTVGLVDVINLSYPEKSYDYANPQQLTDEEVEQLKTMLKPASEGGLLGFKYGEDVLNKTEVLFSITGFMGALAAFPGNHDFHFTIIDNEGNTINPSLMLKSN